MGLPDICMWFVWHKFPNLLYESPVLVDITEVWDFQCFSLALSSFPRRFKTVSIIVSLISEAFFTWANLVGHCPMTDCWLQLCIPRWSQEYLCKRYRFRYRNGNCTFLEEVSLLLTLHLGQLQVWKTTACSLLSQFRCNQAGLFKQQMILYINSQFLVDQWALCFMRYFILQGQIWCCHHS